MRPLSEILTDLIGFAETVITRPNTQIAIPSNFALLASEVRHADGLPAEAIRTTRAALVMVIAIEEFFNGDREPTSPWLMLAGGTLPLLRGEAWRARKNEQEARAGV